MTHDLDRTRAGSWRLALPLLAALATGAGGAYAQQPPQYVAGRVVDSATGVGVMGAEVTLGRVRMVTGTSGEFRLGAVLTGADTLRVRRLGFASHAVAIPAGAAALPIDVRMQAIARHLAPTTVQAVRPRYTGRLAGYYQRLERRTTGQFITRAELDQDKQGLLSHVLQHSPGVHVQRGRGVPIVSMRGRNCRPLVWLDGVALGAAEVDIDAFPPSTLHGVELYLGTVSAPQRFHAVRGKSECGTILLWSRGPDTDPVGRGSATTPEHLEKLLGDAAVFTAEQVDTPASADPVQIRVIYPQQLRATNTTGSVLVEFVVDAGGVVEEGTFGVVSASDPAFVEAVRTAVISASFRPATRAGRRVAQLVRQRFAFGVDASGEGRRP